ncbi:hypothetical protein EMWEY_00035170 [Eimeria maxima]|uniref:Uncharacterized protein n=1 Tax=Eimeria maxima TaxID=5804 RepID=U6M9C5_EIMMA|nr:hypothetical protein EMWEY_00035170 [Eimeria maxima]CDJ60827.1 hypothetical protein EMWEY_00035170 [Eimeria maxima]
MCKKTKGRQRNSSSWGPRPPVVLPYWELKVSGKPENMEFQPNRVGTRSSNNFYHQSSSACGVFAFKFDIAEEIRGQRHGSERLHRQRWWVAVAAVAPITRQNTAVEGEVGDSIILREEGPLMVLPRLEEGARMVLARREGGVAQTIPPNAGHFMKKKTIV